MFACLKRFLFVATDLLFARTILGRAVPFATAGDCYSAAKCPQVCPLLYLLQNIFMRIEVTAKKKKKQW